MTRPLVLAALVTLSALSTSCSLFRHDKSASARIPKPTKTVVLPPEKPRQSKPLYLPPPELAPEEPELAQLPSIEPCKLPPFRAKRPRPVARVKDAAPEPEPEPAEEAAAPLPQLEQILSPAQRAEYNRAIDSNLGRAQHTVEVLAVRRLNSEQATYLDRIKEFIQQAGEARKSDLVRAKNLAERAGILADDLYRSVQ